VTSAFIPGVVLNFGALLSVAAGTMRITTINQVMEYRQNRIHAGEEKPLIAFHPDDKR
jgi:hypothetical protein